MLLSHIDGKGKAPTRSRTDQGTQDDELGYNIGHEYENERPLMAKGRTEAETPAFLMQQTTVSEPCLPGTALRGCSIKIRDQNGRKPESSLPILLFSSSCFKKTWPDFRTFSSSSSSSSLLQA
jgi:hypothetical protein